MRVILLACFLALAPALPQMARAHPHVWVTVKTEVVFDANKAISGFKHAWLFDEYYSAFAVQGLDKNNDGVYDRAELAELAEVNISSLQEFDYFTFPKLAGQLIEREPPKDYWLEYKDGRLTLFLTLPMKEPVPEAKAKDFIFAVYDPTFYVDFAMAKDNPVTLSAAPAGCSPVVKDPDPQTAQGGVSTLSEAYFQNLDASSSDAEQFAKSVAIACQAG
ncbi:MAG: DUF1007 family protein [Rhodomicrobium sp.]|nr:DUF1007 family protein [Rhodomicrobium sp.]